VQETEIELSLGETVHIGNVDVTILDVQEDVIQFQIEPPAGHAEVPVRFDMRRRPQPK
jgi:hypothetical protein